jgi:hypothetical protein
MGSKAMPRTAADKKMGMRHLQMTMKLEKRKIADHRKAATSAKKVGDKGSVRYNLSHMKGHVQDVKERQKAYKKYSKIQAKAIKKANKK